MGQILHGCATTTEAVRRPICGRGKAATELFGIGQICNLVGPSCSPLYSTVDASDTSWRGRSANDGKGLVLRQR